MHPPPLSKMAGKAFSLAALLFLMNTAHPALSFAAPAAKNQQPDFLTYDELKIISAKPQPGGSLEKKLNKLWVTPAINNDAFFSGAKPLKPSDPKLGPILRVTTWNIEKSLHIPEVIRVLTSKDAFSDMLDPERMNQGSRSLENLTRQKNRLAQSDIFVLQEMEIGIKRSHYLDAAAEMANALGMNYAYAPQYLEIDPVTLGLENIDLEEGGSDKEAMDYYQVDAAKYRGVFGCAVLSRYPIKYVEIRPLHIQPYNWYDGEKKKIGFMEKSRRFGTKTVFKNELTRELKVGGRGYFRVDLEVPDLPEKTLTIINVHLEIKCMPEGREEQMREILSYIRGINNPLIMLGDFNAAPTDISPTSAVRIVKRTLKNPTTWLGVGINYISPYGLAINTTRGASNITKNFNNPFAKNIDIVAPNPQYGMFDMIRNYRFKDGAGFDMRGDAERSINGKRKLLANSNQRGRKGFKTTFSVKRALGIVGKFRLDWLFVKQPVNQKLRERYVFAPHFGETLEELNTSLKRPLSDHHPSLIDLPFNEPLLSAEEE